MQTPRQSPRSSVLVTITWLALLGSLWTTADRVVDLVFEEPELTVAVPNTPQEPDNAAEHLLIPSERDVGTATDTIAPSATTALALETIDVVPTIDSSLKAASPPHRARSSPVSFPVPLRI